MNPSVNTPQVDSTAAWLPVLNYEGTTQLYSAGAGTPVSSNALSTDPAPADPDPKKPWEMWDDGLLILNGLATALFGLIENGKIPISNPGLKTDLIAALYGINSALHDVTLAFSNYINNGTPIVVDPPVVNNWPDPNTPHSADLPYFQGAFDILAGAMGILSGSLKEKLAAHPECEVLVDLLDALINSEGDVMKRITAILDPSAN
jgi:hypothetical protein